MSPSASFDLDARRDAHETEEYSAKAATDGSVQTEKSGALLNDRYELIAPRCSGPAGTIWEALDLLTREKILVRRPGAHLATNSGWVYQFLRESVPAMRFSSDSPRFVTAFHVEQDDLGPFLLLEHVSEPTLRQCFGTWSASGRPSVEIVGAVVGDIARALSELHAAGFLYGELKSEEIFVARSDSNPSVRLAAHGLADNRVLLEPGTSIPCPVGRYASPEQADAQPLNVASDVFSLGMLAYECFSGILPRGVFDPLSEMVEGIPGAWSDTVHRCLAFRPERRPTMAAVVAAFSGEVNALAVVPAPVAPAIQPPTESEPPLEQPADPEANSIPQTPVGFDVLPRFDIASRRAAAVGLPELAAYLETMRSVPGGTFPSVDDRRNGAGGRIFEVVVSGFVMGRHAVTVGMWREYCAAVGLEMPDAPEWGWIEDHPMVNVSWEDVAGRGGKGGYCGWASRQAGITLMLPTLAQREFASRDCGKSLEWPWGLNFLEQCVWGSVNSVRDRTAPVFRSNHIHENSVGLVDLAGNVWDWCSDWYSPYESRPVPGRKRFFGGRDEIVLTDPKGTARGDFKGMAGGSWSDYSPILFRCHGHIWDIPQYRSSSVGFRMVSPDA